VKIATEAKTACVKQRSENWERSAPLVSHEWYEHGSLADR